MKPMIVSNWRVLSSKRFSKQASQKSIVTFGYSEKSLCFSPDRFLKEGFVLRMMRVAWLSGRVLGDDLCGTTQFSLSNGMVEMGLDVILYSPGRMTTANFKHIRIDRGSVKGLHSWRIVRALHNHIESINSADHVLVDWRLHAITPLLTGNWTLVDRGPPADQGVLSLFQHQQWKRGWKKARQGTAVSTAHANYIHHETGMDIENISVIPAGVDVARFTPGIKKGVLKMAYQGQIDAHRGVLMLPKILIHLQEKGIEVSLHFHGDGDAAEKIRNMEISGLEITSPVDSDELAMLQSEYDVGFLPMPDRNIWRLASPLKRSEYLASGMVVCGIDHTGHHLPKSEQWLQLFQEEQFVEKCVEWLAEIKRCELLLLQQAARRYAERHLSWNNSVQILVDRISQ